MARQIVGKKLSKAVTYSPDEAGMKEFLSDQREHFETFEQQLDRNLQASVKLLQQLGQNPEDPYHYFKHEFGHDSPEALAAEVIFHIKRMLHEELPIMERLEHAVFLGQASVLIRHYLPQSKAQSEKASGPRKPEVDAIIEDLATVDESNKKLWLMFYGLLDDRGYCPEEKPDGSYVYLSESSDRPTPMTFKTFANKLSKARKG